MKLTEKEDLLLRRALDPASSPNEAEVAMAAFARSLRKRGVSGYDFVPPSRQAQPQGPQARPSDTPPPQPPPPEPPKSSPPPPQPPPQQKAYEQANEPEPTRWTPPPPKPESRFGRWIANCLYQVAFVAVFMLVGKACHDQPVSKQHHLYDGPPAAVAMPTPVYPVGSIQNPYRIEWRQKGWLKRWQALPYGSYYNDRHDKLTQKLSAELPVPDVYVDVPGGFADEEEALAAVPLGCPSLPYQINWSAADAYEHFKNVPSHKYYVDWDGSIKQKP
jgi:hypothetical protein